MRMFLDDVMLIPAPYYLLSCDCVFLGSHILLVKNPVILSASGEFRHCSFFTSPELCQLLYLNKLLENIAYFKYSHPEN